MKFTDTIKEKLQQLHNKMWFTEDSDEVKQVKNDLMLAMLAFYKSQHPRATGRYMYKVTLGNRPQSIEPIVVRFGKPGEKETPVEKILDEKQLYDYYMWKSYRKQLEYAKIVMDVEAKQQIDAVMKIGKLKKKLIELVGESETERFYYKLVEMHGGI